MNSNWTPDAPPPQDTLEARITALILGELPAAEAAELRAQIAADPALAALHARLAATVALVQAAAAETVATAGAGSTAPRQLSEGRRQALLARFKTVSPPEFLPPRRREMPWYLPLGIAAAVVGVAGWQMLGDRTGMTTPTELALSLGGSFQSRPQASFRLEVTPEEAAISGMVSSSKPAAAAPRAPMITGTALPEPEGLQNHTASLKESAQSATEKNEVWQRRYGRIDSGSAPAPGARPAAQPAPSVAPSPAPVAIGKPVSGTRQLEEKLAKLKDNTESASPNLFANTEDTGNVPFRKLKGQESAPPAHGGITTAGGFFAGGIGGVGSLAVPAGLPPAPGPSDPSAAPNQAPALNGAARREAAASAGTDFFAVRSAGNKFDIALPTSSPPPTTADDGIALALPSPTTPQTATSLAFGGRRAGGGGGGGGGGFGGGGGGNRADYAALSGRPGNVPTAGVERGTAPPTDLNMGAPATPAPAGVNGNFDFGLVGIANPSEAKAPQGPSGGRIADKESLGFQGNVTRNQPAIDAFYDNLAVDELSAAKLRAPGGIKKDSIVVLGDRPVLGRVFENAGPMGGVPTAAGAGGSAVPAGELPRASTYEEARNYVNRDVVTNGGQFTRYNLAFDRAGRTLNTTAGTAPLQAQNGTLDWADAESAQRSPGNPALGYNYQLPAAGRTGEGLDQVTSSIADGRTRGSLARAGAENLDRSKQLSELGAANPVYFRLADGEPPAPGAPPSLPPSTPALVAAPVVREETLLRAQLAPVTVPEPPSRPAQKLAKSAAPASSAAAAAQPVPAAELELAEKTTATPPAAGLEKRPEAAGEPANASRRLRSLAIALPPAEPTPADHEQLADLTRRVTDSPVALGQRDQFELSKRLPEVPDRPAERPATPAESPLPEILTPENPFSTFSLNIADVSFKLAAASLEKGVLPAPTTVRSEEFLNAFDYRDPAPLPGQPIGFAAERARDPFAQNRDLLRFAVKTAASGREAGRPLNLVLLLDNSGSMERADRVQIIHEALRVLAAQLRPTDTFSIVTFARTPRLWVDGVAGDQAAGAVEKVSELTPQGGTNLEEALKLAYATAGRHYAAQGVNRVVLLTDGAANLGEVTPAALQSQVEKQRKQGIALDCFGIGWEGYDDEVLEALARHGDGRYGFLNTPEEAANGFAAQLAGALHVAAADVKVQIEFNPQRVTSYRQVGYTKHQLTKEQFRDNTVDAAEIGAAETGNALYVVAVNPQGEGPVATVRVRYRVPGTDEYPEHAWEVPYEGNAPALAQAGGAMRLAAVAAGFAEWLGGSPYATEINPDTLLRVLGDVPAAWGADTRPKHLETMLRQAQSLAGH